MQSGEGARAAAAPDPALFFQALEDRDAVVILVLPEVDEEAAEQPRTRNAKRRRSQAAAAERTVEHTASAYQLKSASPKFRAALERWNKDGKTELRFVCASEQEAQTWGQLLDCIHSMGRQLPADLEAVLRLLLLAREQAAEPVVAACLRELHNKADQLSAGSCLELLTQLDTGVSEHEQLQALGSSLLAAACTCVAKLLSEDAALRGNADVQAQLLAFLGPLQHMLSDSRRRKLFVQLPFQLLRDCIFEDRHVDADTEATVLVAFAVWAQANLSQQDAEAADRINAICSRIRFPDIPAGLLQQYWARWEFLRKFDPTNDILMRAVVAAADPAQLEMWQDQEHTVAEGNQRQRGRSFTAAQFKAKCSSWWHPRQPRLPIKAAATVVDVQVQQPRGQTAVHSTSHYWGGCFWRIELGKRLQGDLGIFLKPALDPKFDQNADKWKPKLMAFALRVKFSLSVTGAARSWYRAVMQDGSWFYPSRETSRGFSGFEHAGQPIAWDEFWAPGSPWLVDGKACVRFTLEAAL